MSRWINCVQVSELSTLCLKNAMEYGLRLMPEIFEKLNPMPYGDAQYMEVHNIRCGFDRQLVLFFLTLQ